MRILVEVTTEKDDTGKEGETLFIREKAWLLQWAMDYKLMYVEDNRLAAVNYTIAICENYKTGQVETYLPTQLRILGKKIEKE